MTSYAKSRRVIFDIFLAFILLCCLKLLYILFILDVDILRQAHPTYYFTKQQVYIDEPRALAYNEDWTTAQGSMKNYYNYRLEEQVAEFCRERYGKGVKMDQFEELPVEALESIVVDTRRNYMFTAVIGASGSKWSKWMVDLDKVDGVRNKDLVKISELVAQGLQKKIPESVFRFYFVRNPLDRVISGYFYYFTQLSVAKRYLNGNALRELVAINNLDVEPRLSQITFEQYLNWVIHGPSSDKHFGLQSHLIQPCHIKYTLHGLFELLLGDRLVVANHVMDLRTPRSDFTTVRNLTTLTEEARALVAQVNPATMAAFYDKYELDYKTWNYSTTEDWWYPFAGDVRGQRKPNPNMIGNDFPRVRDLVSGSDEPNLNETS